MFTRWTWKKELSLHLTAALIFFIPLFVLILLRTGINSVLILFALGVIVGTYLPNIDHLIYVYFLKPNDLTSKRVVAKFKDKHYRDALILLFDTREERTFLIFRTIFFQCIFLAFAFLVTTSNVNAFGRSLVLAFLLTLLVDEFVVFKRNASLRSLFYALPKEFNKENFKIYLIVQFLLLLLLAYVL